MRWSYRGIKSHNESAPLVAEYIHRMSLTKVGFRSDFSEMSIFKANCFSLIATEISALEKEEHKKQMQKAKIRGRR